MKNKNLIITLVITVVVIGTVLTARQFSLKWPAKKSGPAAAAKAKEGKLPAKKVISKDKGGLTVKLVDSKKRELSLRARAFRTIDSKSSVYITSLVANRMHELSPGTYDIEIDTTPQMIYKNIKVVKGEETISDLGSITGMVDVKILNAQKKAAYYPYKILYSKSSNIAVSAATNRPIELLPGLYDIEIGTLPRQIKKDVRVESGKETILDLGCTTGYLNVKALDEDKKEARLNARITKSENNELVASTAANRPIELLHGAYNIELLSTPKQDKKAVKVNAGEETLVEFTVAKAAPALPQSAPPKPIKK